MPLDDRRPQRGQAPGDCAACRAEGRLGVPVAEIVRLTLRDLAADVALCDEHRSALDAMLVPALQLSRRSIERRVPSQRGSGFPRLRADEDREAIREWARAQGLPVAASGTISAAVLESYRAAHNKQRA